MRYTTSNFKLSSDILTRDTTNSYIPMYQTDNLNNENVKFKLFDASKIVENDVISNKNNQLAIGNINFFEKTSNNIAIGNDVNVSNHQNGIVIGNNAAIYSNDNISNYFYNIIIGDTAESYGSNNIAIGHNAYVLNGGYENSIALGYNAKVGASNATAIGYNCYNTYDNSFMFSVGKEKGNDEGGEPSTYRVMFIMNEYATALKMKVLNNSNTVIHEYTFS